MPGEQLANSYSYIAATRFVNEIRDPNTFLKNFLFPREDARIEENINIPTYRKGRTMAGFTKRGAGALLVNGVTADETVITTPNIRLKQNFVPDDYMFNRWPGAEIFDANPEAVARERQALDLQQMAFLVTNAEEFLCSGILTGTVSYEVADEAAFTIANGRDPSHDVTPANSWGTANSTPIQDIHSVKRLLQVYGLAPTDAICGKNAADAFIAECNKDTRFLDKSSYSQGNVDAAEQFNEAGVIYLGQVAGTRFWEYSRQVTQSDGTVVDLIREDYIEFVDRRNEAGASDRVTYYGGINDIRVMGARRAATRRFSKSWIDDDENAMVSLIASRPLPYTRRPNATVSFKAV